MIKDKVVVLTRELVDELISALNASDTYWHLANSIREQMERKETPLFNSPTFAEDPLTLSYLKSKFGAYLKRREFSFEDFAFSVDKKQTGPWVKNFWESGTYGNGVNGDPLPSWSGHYWDSESQTGLFYLQLQDHEIVFNLDMSVVKVRKDISQVKNPDKEESQWTLWDDEGKWLSSSVQDLANCIENSF